MFQILSLSGGGYLGLYSAAVLAEIESTTGVPIARHFDLLAGTSIGGIIALALAREVSAKDIQVCFEEHGQKIFSARPAPQPVWPALYDIIRRSLLFSKYDPAPLRDTITEILGANTRLGDLKHPVIIPAVNLTRGSTKLFKTPHHQDFKIDYELRAVDVALATAAAPTYFPLAEIKGELFADGGLFANSPDLMAVHEATHFFGHGEAEVRLLSVGTTTAKYSFAHPKSLKLGVIHWLSGARLLNVSIAAQQQSVDFMLRHRLPGRYLRLDEYQSKEQERALGLDVATDEAKKTANGMAHGTFQNAVNDPLLMGMLEYSAPPPHFFYGANSG
jgi:hypothetical protein